jgi:hypothetical protein
MRALSSNPEPKDGTVIAEALAAPPQRGSVPPWQIIVDRMQGEARLTGVAHAFPSHDMTVAKGRKRVNLFEQIKIWSQTHGPKLLILNYFPNY